MLVLLGVLAMRRSLRGLRLHAHRHSHDGSEHVHVHVHKRDEQHADHHHAHPLGFGLRPFAVGVMHGLAGSAGLALVVMGAAPSALAGLAYLFALALGSTAGMFALSALMSLPLQLLASRYRVLHLRVQMLAGACSLALGLLLFGRHALGLS
jgi:cytochrome c biogenesis protein CcdA